MKISIIVAMDEERGIGKNNDLLFKIPEDFARMKKLTSGHTIIMGRKTFESIGKLLPGRYNIVITRNPSFKIEGLRPAKNGEIVNSLEEAIKIAKEREEGTPLRASFAEAAAKAEQGSEGQREIFIFGGGQIFKEALPITDKLYLTIVRARLDSPPESPARRGDFHADTFFPEYSDFKKEIYRKEGKSGGYKFTFLDLER